LFDVKKWKSGIAGETWKVIICGRDLHRIDDILSALSYYLTDAGVDVDRGLSLIRSMSGDQIIDALEDHKRTSIQSVEAAIGTVSAQNSRHV